MIQVYGSLDYESRFFGKEIISLFANRFGKSTTAIALAVLSSSVPSFGSIAPIILLCGDAIWLGISYRLGSLLVEKSKVD
jgi:ATP/ADP translocase